MDGGRGRRQEWDPPAVAPSPTCPQGPPSLVNLSNVTTFIIVTIK